MPYSVEGRAHRALRILSAGPETIYHVHELLGANTPELRRDIRSIVQSMVANGLVLDRHGLLHVTDYGLDGLQVLDGGYEFASTPPRPVYPGARVFERRVS